MKIALINESSQAPKNKLILDVLKKTVEPLGHEVFNYGMSDDDPEFEISYVEAGLMAGILLNSGAVDFVITGCGTGEGANIATNIYPNVYCGYVKDSTDAYLFSQINNGNAISLPFAKGFGWCAELNLEYIFKELFSCEHGIGYPPERGLVQKEFRKVLYTVKEKASKNMMDVLKDMDPEILKRTVSGKAFQQYFPEYAKDLEMLDYVKSVMEGE